jgi:hypothetical protein
MGLYDDMFDLDDHFTKLVRWSEGKKKDLPKLSKREAEGMQEAWKRICLSHAEMEQNEMLTQPVVGALLTIFRTFKLTNKAGVNKMINDHADEAAQHEQDNQ